MFDFKFIPQQDSLEKVRFLKTQSVSAAVLSIVQYIGKRAMQGLFWRMSNPDAPLEMIKITSSIYYKNSTEGYEGVFESH